MRVQRRGATTTRTTDLPRDIAEALERSAAERGVFGRRVHYFAETGSTNDLAMRAADRGEPEGTVYAAGAQTAGRGRLGRVWFSPPGAGLYVSTIVRREQILPWITLAAGVAAASGIHSATGLPVEIKWPNDIIASGRAFRSRRKLAGILAEASAADDGSPYVVLGFGINLRRTAFPPELANRATAIEVELGREVDAGSVLAQTLVALNDTTERLTRGGPEALLAAWLARAPSAHGTAIEWDAPEGTLHGTTAGIAADGALLMQTGTGLVRIRSGELRWI
jgi:BirA family biotin operon repressor/biotin-[acetyl-CoA-carboxylase] ligase